ncbi:hypothetical protein NDI37_18995 [Funiculus sociatus GB2-A5]|uniref:Uncharacterized protein n=1 Tax=Funiculus sociatus GB2-A5 TaxID=2933946 RepID=A0ABV0JT28_9CYAN|nr:MULTISPECIES: hypothetical protein [unclassified Trichocoleus]MBD1906936.1 hypothetical protein [Trichocoleus sp. FACHB-832]MBD2063447.1 hypothetical protein [Trichocoleus sp. FACHB-6]
MWESTLEAIALILRKLSDESLEETECSSKIDESWKEGYLDHLCPKISALG